MTAASLLVLSLVAADANQPASRGVLLDFTATWCGPCQQMNPVVSRLKRQGYPVRKVDVDRERALAQRFNVRSMPTFILVVDGKERNRIVGMTSEAQLRKMLAQIPRGPKPSVGHSRPIANVNPTAIAKAAPKPKAPTRKLPFTFPFGGKKEPEAKIAAQPAVIRAKLDQDKAGPEITVEDEPLASSVRVRISSGDGVNYGSGTIIQSQKGRTVILTCGHIFRDLDPGAKIEVDVFTGGKAETYLGKSIGFDLEGDVGLLAITTDSPLPTSTLAGAVHEVKKRQSVYSIGCGGGDPPSREDIYVTALNRYLGPDNIECTGEPLQGRSGGGLFNADGEVVGVCVAADPRDERGLYAGLRVIHDLLQNHNMAALLPKSRFSQTAIAKAAAEPKIAPPVETAVAKGRDIAVPDALKNAGEAEVICIVRPLNQPKSASQVVILNRASSRFVSYLTQEMKDQPVPTVHRKALANSAKALEAPPFAETETPEPPPFANATTVNKPAAPNSNATAATAEPSKRTKYQPEAQASGSPARGASF